MPLLAGTDANTVLGAAPASAGYKMAPHVSVRWIATVLRHVHGLSSAGLANTDIKPENIMIVPSRGDPGYGNTGGSGSASGTDLVFVDYGGVAEAQGSGCRHTTTFRVPGYNTALECQVRQARPHEACRR